MNTWRTLSGASPPPSPSARTHRIQPSFSTLSEKERNSPHTPLLLRGKRRPLLLIALLGVPLLYHLLHLFLRSQGLSINPTPQSCHPYHAFGHLTVDPLVPERNRYHPFRPDCSSPQLFRSVRRKLGLAESEAVQMEEEKTEWRPEDVEFVRGRTVLIIGDSTGREQLKQFCDFIAQNATIRYPEGFQHGYRDASLPHTCYSPELDFLLVSVFHFGLDEDDFWKEKDQYNPPGLFEDRIDQLVLPLTSDLEALLPSRPKPGTPKRRVDLVEVSSGLWDLARSARMDVEAGRSTITDHTAEYLHWYRRRVLEIMKKTLGAFPHTKIVWRSTHYPSDKNAKIDWFLGWNYNDDTKHRPFFHHNRILQLDQAARSALLPEPGASAQFNGLPRVEFNEWGNILLGQHAHQKDQLHPGPLPAGWLGADIMFYELREAVRGQRQGAGSRHPRQLMPHMMDDRLGHE